MEEYDGEPFGLPSCSHTNVLPLYGRTFVRTFSVSATTNDQPFNVIFKPNALDSLEILGESATVLPPNWQMLSNSGTQPDLSSTIKGFPTVGGDLKIYNSAHGTVGSYASSFDTVNQVHVWDLIGNATTSINVGWTSTGTALLVWKRVGGSLINVGESLMDNGSASIVVPAAPGGFDGIVVAIANPSDFSEGTTKLSFSPVSGTDPVLVQACSYNLFSTDITTLGRVSSLRITAACLLCSFSGNTLDNGGVIAAARTRAHYIYDETTPYQSLTKLQDHSYRGVLKDGAYVWWLPYDLEEMDPRPIHSRIDGTEMHVAGHFESDKGSLEITLVMVAEFYSPLQIFEHQPGPPLEDNFVRAYHALDGAPAASCNPAHTKILKKGLTGMKNTAKSVGKFALSNPELVGLLTGTL